MTDVRYPEVEVELIGLNGNAFNLIGVVAQAIGRSVGQGAAQEFRIDAMEQGSYDELLALIQRTVTVR